jgi:hypothetical protein
MAGKTISVEIPDEMLTQLAAVADALGVSRIEEAALLAIADWTAQRKADLDDRDPSQKYFVNEALDKVSARDARKK